MSTREAVIRHQHGFDLAHLGSRFPEPRQQRIFLVTGRARQTPDAVPFGQLGEGLQDVARGCAAPMEQSAFGGCERVWAGPTLIAWLPIPGSTEFDHVPLPRGLRFPVITAVGIGTEITDLD